QPYVGITLTLYATLFRSAPARDRTGLDDPGPLASDPRGAHGPDRHRGERGRTGLPGQRGPRHRRLPRALADHRAAHRLQRRRDRDRSGARRAELGSRAAIPATTDGLRCDPARRVIWSRTRPHREQDSRGTTLAVTARA